jgi:hypothetical protein
VVWSASPGHQADVIVTDWESVKRACDTHPDQLVLGLIQSPLSVAMFRSLDIVEKLASDPEGGEETLSALSAECKSRVESVKQQGGHGILYFLNGAHPEVTSPMQYGGYFLEVDRELLSHASDMELNILFIAGRDEDIYLDVVGDLPPPVVGWDNATITIPVDQARQSIQRKIALDHPHADFLFASHYDEIERLLERAIPIKN